jgi:molybdate transport system permease protein
MGSVLLSLEVASLATLLAGSLGIALAGLLAHKHFPGRRLVDAALTSPLVLPPSVLGYYLIVLLGRRGALGQWWEQLTHSTLVFSFTGAIIAACVTSFPFVFQSSRAALEAVDQTLVEAARTLGASSLRTFYRVLLPLASRGVIAGVVLGFARALGDFGTTLIVAGNIPGETQTASLKIYDEVLTGRAGEATPLVLTMTGIAIILMAASQSLASRPHR